MNHAARHIGRTLAFVLPVVLVLSGTLAVARVPWGEPPADASVRHAGAERGAEAASDSGQIPGTGEDAAVPAPQDALQEQLLAELQASDPSSALTTLQQEMDRAPELKQHCPDIARSLGQAAVEKYGSPEAAQEYARPVCDTSFATGVLDMLVH